MPRPLNVLLIESHPGAGAADADRLEASGHHVHRCHPAPWDDGARRGAAAGAYLCAGVTQGACPLDAGVDVALVVRHRLAPRPSATEGGVSCSIRAGVPVVEDGPEVFDPFEPWLAGRVEGDVAAACVDAVSTALESLQAEVARRVGDVLRGAGLEPSSVTASFEQSEKGLRVVLEGPPLNTKVEQALAVRILDAVRKGRRTYREVNISYSATS